MGIGAGLSRRLPVIVPFVSFPGFEEFCCTKLQEPRSQLPCSPVESASENLSAKIPEWNTVLGPAYCYRR